MDIPAALFTPVEDLEITGHHLRILKGLGLHRAGDLATATDREILLHPNAGRSKIWMSNEALASVGDFRLGMAIEGWERPVDTSGLLESATLQRMLGELHTQGHRFANQRAIAVMWLTLAADAGDALARAGLGRLGTAGPPPAAT